MTVKKTLKKKKETTARKRVTFRIEAPGAQSVAVAGTFNNWDIQAHPLKEAGSMWCKSLYLVPGTYEYRFVVDGIWCDDPSCAESVSNEFGTANGLLRI